VARLARQHLADVGERLAVVLVGEVQRGAPSIAVLTRVISRSVVSLPDASQSAQMRLSTSFALSASGAALSASNRKSRFLVRSPRAARGSFSGASAQLPGSA
jgi:hypothetical protein